MDIVPISSPVEGEIITGDIVTGDMAENVMMTDRIMTILRPLVRTDKVDVEDESWNGTDIVDVWKVGDNDGDWEDEMTSPNKIIVAYRDGSAAVLHVYLCGNGPID